MPRGINRASDSDAAVEQLLLIHSEIAGTLAFCCQPGSSGSQLAGCLSTGIQSASVGLCHDWRLYLARPRGARVRHVCNGSGLTDVRTVIFGREGGPHAERSWVFALIGPDTAPGAPRFGGDREGAGTSATGAASISPD